MAKSRVDLHALADLVSLPRRAFCARRATAWTDDAPFDFIRAFECFMIPVTAYNFEGIMYTVIRTQ